MTLGVTQGHENIDSALLVIWHVNEEQPQILRLAALAQDDRSWFKGGYFQGRSLYVSDLKREDKDALAVRPTDPEASLTEPARRSAPVPLLLDAAENRRPFEPACSRLA